MDSASQSELEILRSRVAELERREAAHRSAEATLRARLGSLTAPDQGGADTPRLQDLLDLSEVQALQDAFAEATGVASIITDVHGVPITRPSGFCRVCLDMIRRSPQDLGNCMASAAMLGSRAEGPTVRPCLSGNLLGGGASICVGDRHIANWLIGQIIDEGFDEERLLDCASTMGADREAFRAALAEVTPMPRQHFESAGRALLLFAQAISRLAYHNHQQARHIAERDRAERALRESEARLRLLTESVRDVIWTADLQFRFTYVSPSVTALRGFPVEEAMQQRLDEVMTPESAERSRRVLAEELELVKRGAAASGRTRSLELEMLRNDGTTVWTELRAGFVLNDAGVPIGMAGVTRDISERKRSEAALKESEERYRNLFESSGDAIVAVDLRGKFVDGNPAALRLLGYTREELLQLTYREITPARWRERSDAVVNEEVPRLGYSDEYEKEYVRKDGSTIPVNVRAFVKRDLSGAHVGSWAIVRDMTERRRAEEALRESEERFRVAFQTSLDAIIITRAEDGVFVAVNEGFLRMTGWSEAEVIGRSSLDLPLWGERSHRHELLERLRTSGPVQNLEVTLRRKDGTALPGLLSARLMTLRGEPYVLSTTRDMSDWKRAEAERGRLRLGLHEAAKMQAIGQLAGGIAHDFNNLLTVILSGAEALGHDLGERSLPDPEIVGEIGSAAERARDLTRQLLAFARRQVIAPVPLDVNEVVRGSEKLLRRVLGEDIELTVTLHPGLWTVRCDPGQLEQVILNLAVNARDAMSSGGKLTIDTANVIIDERFTTSRPWMHAGEYARLSIRDSGQGMSPEVKAHLFEPFFTTKPPGKGTGLGLATVYGIVKQNEGYILVETELAHGTTFEILLPRVASSPVEPPPRATVSASAGTETILVVEDDAQVREVTVRSLRSAGYRVLVARGGEEALEVAARERDLPQLLVTDVLMPGLDGRALAAQLRARDPELRVLYVSGHAEDVIARRGVLEPGIDFLAKPFTAASLLASVRAVLERERS